MIARFYIIKNEMELMLERERPQEGKFKHKISAYDKSQYVQDCMCDKKTSCRVQGLY